MIRPVATCVCALSFAVAGLLAAPSRALAQACCAGATTLSPARLALHEAGLVAIQLRAAPVIGAFDASGNYHGNPDHSGELDLGQDVIAALRVLHRGQLAVLLPIVETWRQAPGLDNEASLGLGDLNLSARWDFIDAGEYELMPGLAVLAGLTVPTGTPPDRAEKVLATDATGVGAVQATGGIAFEQLFDPILVSVSGLLSQRFARSVNGSDEKLGLQWTLAVAAGRIWPSGGLALLASLTGEGNATTNGHEALDSGRRLFSVGLAGGTVVSGDWRVQGSLQITPPIDGLGANQNGAVSLAFTLIRSWM